MAHLTPKPKIQGYLHAHTNMKNNKHTMFRDHPTLAAEILSPTPHPHTLNLRNPGSHRHPLTHYNQLSHLQIFKFFLLAPFT